MSIEAWGDEGAVCGARCMCRHKSEDHADDEGGGSACEVNGCGCKAFAPTGRDGSHSSGGNT